jgi:hypothetical protein
MNELLVREEVVEKETRFDLEEFKALRQEILLRIESSFCARRIGEAVRMEPPASTR